MVKTDILAPTGAIRIAIAVGPTKSEVRRRRVHCGVRQAAPDAGGSGGMAPRRVQATTSS